MEGDDMTQAFDTACSPENPCGEPMFAEPGECCTEGGPESLTVTIDWSSGKRAHGFGQEVIMPRQKMFRSSRPGISPLFFDGYCSDIIMAVTGNRMALQNTRTHVAKELFAGTLSEVGNWAAGWVVPSGTLGAGAITTLGVEYIPHKVDLTILKTLWNSHSCSERSFVVGDYFLPGSSTVPTSLTPELECNEYPATFYFLGDYIHTAVRVCAYTGRNHM
jgi:hypothetical protein